MLGMRRGLPSTRMRWTPSARRICPHAMGAQVHAGSACLAAGGNLQAMPADLRRTRHQFNRRWPPATVLDGLHGLKAGSTNGHQAPGSSRSSTDSGSCTPPAHRPRRRQLPWVSATWTLPVRSLNGWRRSGLGRLEGPLGAGLTGFLAAAVLDEVGDGADLEAVFCGKASGPAGGPWVVFREDLADDRSRREAGHAARSQPASVWPARIKARRRLAPGWGRCGRAAPDQPPHVWRPAAWMVRARSAAEMPVVTPVAASMDTVKAVP